MDFELDLIQKAKAGDNRAMTEIVRRMEFTCKNVALKWEGTVPLDEGICAAKVSLFYAVRGYDPRKGNFYKYAKVRMRKALQEIGYFTLTFGGFGSVGWNFHSLKKILLSGLTREQKAEKLNVSVEEVCRRLNTVNAISLDEKVTADGDISYIDLVCYPTEEQKTSYEMLLECEQSNLLRKLVKKLPEKQREVTEGIFFEEKSSVQLAQELGISFQAVHHRRIDAIRNLKRQSNRYKADFV